MVIRGRGKGKRLLGEDNGSKNIEIRLVSLNAHGPRAPYHYHAKTENIYIILSGKAKVTVEGKERLIRKGTLVYIRPGERHTIQNIGSTELRLIEIYCPPMKEDFIGVNVG